jgi:hypothetical protein
MVRQKISPGEAYRHRRCQTIDRISLQEYTFGNGKIPAEDFQSRNIHDLLQIWVEVGRYRGENDNSYWNLSNWVGECGKERFSEALVASLLLRVLSKADQFPDLISLNLRTFTKAQRCRAVRKRASQIASRRPPALKLWKRHHNSRGLSRASI